MTERKHVKIFSDGSCLGNPGPGGYGVVLAYGDHRKELSLGFRRTTNNRMELLGAIVGTGVPEAPLPSHADVGLAVHAPGHHAMDPQLEAQWLAYGFEGPGEERGSVAAVG